MVGDCVYIGLYVLIVEDIMIGDGFIIGVGSVVICDVFLNLVVVGNFGCVLIRLSYKIYICYFVLLESKL